MKSAKQPKNQLIILASNNFTKYILTILVIASTCGPYIYGEIWGNIQNSRIRPIYLKADEPSYVTRINRLQQNNGVLSNQWVLENSDEPALIPYLVESIIAAIAKCIKIDGNGILITLRVLVPMLWTSLLYLILISLGFSYWTSIFIASIIVTDPGIYYYKPFLSILTSIDTHPLNRFSNPFIGLSVFLISIMLQHRNKYVLSGLFLGLSFHISVYYWSHLTLSFLILLLFKKWRKNALTSLLIGIAIGIPAILKSISVSYLPHYNQIKWRLGLMIDDEGYYLLSHKFQLILMIMYSTIIYFKRKSFFKDRHSVFLLSLLSSGTFLYFSTLVTGKSLQNFHWNYGLSIIFFISLIYEFQKPISRFSRILPIFALISILSGLLASDREIKSIWPLPEETYYSAIDWINKNTSDKSVILASPYMSVRIASFTGRYIFLNNVAETSEGEDILMRHSIQWYLKGLSSTDLESTLTKTHVNHPIAHCDYGLGPISYSVMSSLKWPACHTDNLNKYFQSISLDYAIIVKDIDFLQLPYKLNYIVSGPLENYDSVRITKNLGGILVWNDSKVSIFKIDN